MNEIARDTSGPLVTVDNLVFDYPGRRALAGVSLTIDRGTITALVGPNGAGKTTLLNCIAALALPAAGHVTVDGVDVHASPRRAHKRMGYLADFFGLYRELTVRRCLEYRARALKIDAAHRPAAIDRAATRMGLTDRLNDRAGTLSRGLRQRLAIAQTIIHEPPFVMLDEPASGLDPAARVSLSAVFRELRDAGMTLVVSSHILAELEDYSTHMLVIDNGRVVEHRALGGIDGERRRLVRIRLAAPDARLDALLADIDAECAIDAAGLEARFRLEGGHAAEAALLRRLIESGLAVAEFGPVNGGLQDAYLALLRAGKTA
ncbi:MAG: ABC transporter ATP-binding protein [Dongiaceae bacterium]